MSTISSLFPTGSPNAIRVTADTQMVANRRYLVDTSSGPITMTLPLAPLEGVSCWIIDAAGTFGVNSCIIARNGEKIMGLSENTEVDQANQALELVYGSSTKGWRISTINPLTESGAVAARKNLIINGNFNINQRGLTDVTSGYGTDRWHTGSSGLLNRSTDVPGNGARVSLSCAASSGAVAPYVNTSVELPTTGNIYPFLLGETYTISGWIKSSVAQDFTLAFSYRDTIGGAGDTPIESTTISATTGWTYFTHTFSVDVSPIVTSKAMQIRWTAATVGSTFYLSQIQLEKGAEPTDFEQMFITDEFVRCQRYFQVINPFASGYHYGTNGGLRYGFEFSLPTGMRTSSPTVTELLTPSYSNCSDASVVCNGTFVQGRVTVTATGIYRLSGGKWSIDGEL